MDEKRQFSAKDLEKTFGDIADMTPDKRDTFISQVAASKVVWKTIIKYGLWTQYELLASFTSNTRMNDIARGGINALEEVFKFLESLESEHNEKLLEEQEDFDKHSPLPNE